MNPPVDSVPTAGRGGCLQGSPYLPARSRLPRRLGWCSHGSQSSMCGGCEGNLGLEQAGGLQAAFLVGDLLGDPAKAAGNLFKSCKSKEGRVTERWVFCGR